jgi:hypothetical protein
MSSWCIRLLVGLHQAETMEQRRAHLMPRFEDHSPGNSFVGTSHRTFPTLNVASLNLPEEAKPQTHTYEIRSEFRWSS